MEQPGCVVECARARVCVFVLIGVMEVNITVRRVNDSTCSNSVSLLFWKQVSFEKGIAANEIGTMDTTYARVN